MDKSLTDLLDKYGQPYPIDDQTAASLHLPSGLLASRPFGRDGPIHITGQGASIFHYDSPLSLSDAGKVRNPCTPMRILSQQDDGTLLEAQTGKRFRARVIDGIFCRLEQCSQ